LGLTGFGSAPISLPLLLLVYGPTTVVALAPVLSNVHQRGGGVIVVESIDRAIVFALLFTALGEVVVGVEVLRVADPEYVRLGWLLRCRLGAAPSAGRRAARGGIALGPVVAGWASGALSTSTAPLAGPPIVLLLASCGFLKRAFRGSSAL
jgi:uncharacterized protein